MDVMNLTFHCSGCDEWFTRASIPRTEMDDEEFMQNDRIVNNHYCNCGQPVYDAHETGTTTPYDELRLKVLEEQVDSLQDMINRLQNQMTNIDGVRR
jgi:hypothetical protein